MQELLIQPWPGYLAGLLLGLMVPAMLLLGGKQLGIAMCFKATLSMIGLKKIRFFDYDWRNDTWRFFFIGGLVIGGFLGGNLFANPENVAITASTIDTLRSYGVQDFSGLLPNEMFASFSPGALFLLLLGGFLIGFGSRYANGCTSGHVIMGISYFQKASMIAAASFFAGGLIMTHLLLKFIYPLVF